MFTIGKYVVSSMFFLLFLKNTLQISKPCCQIRCNYLSRQLSIHPDHRAGKSGLLNPLCHIIIRPAADSGKPCVLLLIEISARQDPLAEQTQGPFPETLLPKICRQLDQNNIIKRPGQSVTIIALHSREYESLIIPNPFLKKGNDLLFGSCLCM